MTEIQIPNYEIFKGGQCEVAIIERSINGYTGRHLVTFQLKYPRFVHSEFMTHRDFSRNASSSRAIPAAKLIKMQRENPAFFVHVGTNQPGMQAGDEVSPEIKAQFHKEWVELANIVADYQARWADEYKIHKQIVNRPGEAFHYINVVMTTSKLNNFFGLRRHVKAQPEIKDLADTMALALEAQPARNVQHDRLSDPRAWHLPYISMEERKNMQLVDLLKTSAARCARVSYLNHDKTHNTLEENAKLHDLLATEQPMHASPMEHQALATSKPHVYGRNFDGNWAQYRAMVEHHGLEGFAAIVGDLRKAETANDKLMAEA